MEDTFVNSVIAVAPAAHVFELDYRFISKPMSHGLFYDLATLEEFDFSEERWRSYFGIVGENSCGGKSKIRRLQTV